MTCSPVLASPSVVGAQAPLPVSDAARDEVFVRTLYEQHGTVLLGFATRLCHGDWHQAEDIVQEATVRAWRNQAALDPTSKEVRTWLFTVIRRLVIDRHRALQSRPEEIRDSEVSELSVPDPAEQATTSAVVTAAMAKLSAQQREVLAYLYYLDYSISQTSSALGIPAGTVKSRAYYSVRALRKALQRHSVMV